MAAALPPAPRARRSGLQRGIIALGAVVSVSMLVSATALGWGYWKLSHVDRVSVDLPAAATGAPQNYLIVGSDSRASGDPNDPGAQGREASSSERSDTIMVLRVDPSRSEAAMLSLPRDLWVPIAGRSGRRQRINTAYSTSKQTLVDTIQQDFGIPVHHYVEMDFRGFQGLVQAIDGVPMWFDEPMRDRQSGLSVQDAGCTLLDGPGALAFARARHVEFFGGGRWHFDGTGDLGRISRQQLFIRRAIQRAVDKGLDNPLTLKRLVEIGSRNISIDAGLSLRQLLALGRRFERFNSETLRTFTLPATPYRTNGGAAVLRLDEVAAQPLLNIFRGHQLDDLSESNVQVTVLNSSGRPGEAANVAGALMQAKFKVDRWGNGSELGHARERRTLVRYAPGAQAAADLLARHLTSGADRTEDPSLQPGQVALFVGADFTTVEATARARDDASTSTTARSSTGPVETTVRSTTTSSTTTTTAPIPTTSVVGRIPGDPPPDAHC